MAATFQSPKSIVLATLGISREELAERTAQMRDFLGNSSAGSLHVLQASQASSTSSRPHSARASSVNPSSSNRNDSASDASVPKPGSMESVLERNAKKRKRKDDDQPLLPPPLSRISSAHMPQPAHITPSQNINAFPTAISDPVANPQPDPFYAPTPHYPYTIPHSAIPYEFNPTQTYYPGFTSSTSHPPTFLYPAPYLVPALPFPQPSAKQHAAPNRSASLSSQPATSTARTSLSRSPQPSISSSVTRRPSKTPPKIKIKLQSSSPAPTSSPISSVNETPTTSRVVAVSSPAPISTPPRPCDYSTLPFTVPSVIYPADDKPNLSYAALIGRAILASTNSPIKCLSLNDIYTYITIAFPYYQRDEVGWMNSIRHNLSLNASFVKYKRPRRDVGKGALWGILEEDLPCFAGGGYVRRNKAGARRKRAKEAVPLDHEPEQELENEMPKKAKTDKTVVKVQQDSKPGDNLQNYPPVVPPPTSATLYPYYPSFIYQPMLPPSAYVFPPPSTTSQASESHVNSQVNTSAVPSSQNTFTSSDQAVTYTWNHPLPTPAVQLPQQPGPSLDASEPASDCSPAINLLFDPPSATNLAQASSLAPENLSDTETKVSSGPDHRYALAAAASFSEKLEVTHRTTPIPLKHQFKRQRSSSSTSPAFNQATAPPPTRDVSPSVLCGRYSTPAPPLTPTGEQSSSSPVLRSPGSPDAPLVDLPKPKGDTIPSNRKRKTEGDLLDAFVMRDANKQARFVLPPLPHLSSSPTAQVHARHERAKAAKAAPDLLTRILQSRKKNKPSTAIFVRPPSPTTTKAMLIPPRTPPTDRRPKTPPRKHARGSGTLVNLSPTRTPLSHRGLHMSPSPSLAPYKGNLHGQLYSPIRSPGKGKATSSLWASENILPGTTPVISNAPSTPKPSSTPKRLLFPMAESPAGLFRRALDPFDPSALLADEFERLAGDGECLGSPIGYGMFGSKLYQSPSLPSPGNWRKF